VSSIITRIKINELFPERLILAGFISLPIVMLVLIAAEKYLGIAAILVIFFLVIIIQNYKYGLYFIVIGLPLFQSISTQSDAATSTGINLQYVLIPVVFVAWLSEKLTKKKLAEIRLPFLSLFTLFVGALAISIIHQMDVVSISHIKHGIIQIYALVNYLVLFYILVNEELEQKDIQRILWGFLIVAFFASLLGIYQYFTISADQRTGMRVTSIFGSLLRTDTKSNPNDFGTYLAFMIMVAIWVWNMTKEKREKIFIGIIVAAAFGALLLSFSRSSLLATIFAVLFYTSYRSKKALLITIFVVIFGLVALYFEPRFQSRINSIFQILSDKRIINIFLNINPQNLDWGYIEYYGIQGYGSDIISGAFRIWAWIQGVQLFWAHPFLGVGYHLTLAYSPWPTAENLYLDFASMTGIVGLTLFIIIQVNFLKDGFKLLKSPRHTHIGMFWLNILAVVFFVSLTGSILFGGKLLGIFFIITALFYNVKYKQNDHIYQQ